MIAGVAFSLSVLGLLDPLERALQDLRFRLLPGEASGSLVVVEIDAKSLQELGVWPWPRRYHGRLLDRLFEAGAERVAFDVDFSAASNPEDDRLFAESLSRHAGRVILPSFRQRASQGSDVMLVNHPLPAFASQVDVGGVNVLPDDDGIIRLGWVGQRSQDGFRPSLITWLAGTGYFPSLSFAIDFGIDPDSIPRLSFVDVLEGRVDPTVLAGHKVIIGSTAIELGDTFAVPVYQVISGVVLQAVAYETLLQGRALTSTGWPVVLVLAVLIAFLFEVGRHDWSTRRISVFALLGAGLLFGGAVAAQHWLNLHFIIVPLLLCLLLSFASGATSEIKRLARVVFRQRADVAYRKLLVSRVVDESPDGILITDEQGLITVANPASEVMLGLQQDELVGAALAEVFPQGQDLLAAAMSQDDVGVRAGEVTFVRSDARDVTLEVSASRSQLQMGRNPEAMVTNVFHVVMLRDITDRKLAEEAQHTATEQIMAASRAKSEFLANMSHELRTPLNAIIGFSQVIQSGAFGELSPPKYLDYVNDIHDSGKRLLDVVNDVIDVSRIETGEFKMTEDEVDLPKLLRACADIFAGTLGGTSKQFHMELAPDLPPILADSRLIKQITLNLLSNAAKFTEDTGAITLLAYRDDSNRPVIEVIDNGCGIPAEDIPRLTDPFYQVDSSLARTHEGTGLGLYLVNHYTVMHGGTFSIESDEGRGTMTRITLPAQLCLPDEAEPGDKAKFAV